ncbi:hypothetical protein [Xenorhabdus littoralis]|uniref:hypothetical protein n=1 Tax=Xenorhabdus littoralis TaxID=2582835 RepID=UPI0029E7D245|nr:hypothetical protein [Xenorhabdus sp. psl]MDX7990583.1 hypothetical protein [Xenorhabdus sp. psl]
MRLLTQILFFSFMSLISLPSIAGLYTPDRIMRQVHERGINSVVAELSEEREMDKIIHHISTGDSQWLRVAFKLSPNIHPIFSEKTISALSFALINNPVEVLSLAENHRTLASANICTIPSTIHNLQQQKSFFGQVMNSLNAARKANTGKSKNGIDMCMWEFEKNHSVYF